LIGKITTANFKKCESTVFLGKFLKEHAERRWGISKKSHVIDISTDLSLYDKQISSLVDTSKVIIHYGGQMGHLHDAKSIIESVKFVLQSDIRDAVEFNFYVSGAQAKFLEDSLKDFPVKVISAIPSFQWREDIKDFHIGLVSLSPGGATVCLPSKTYGMMAGGMSILAICPIWSDLSELITDLNAGWIVNNSRFNSVDNLRDSNYANNIIMERDRSQVALDVYKCLKHLIENRSLLEDKRRNAFDGVQKKHNINVSSEKWGKVLSNI
jgi:hypothetical protein